MSTLNDNISNLFYVDEETRKTKELQGEEFSRRKIHKYEKCGTETIEFVNSLNPLLVLDLGCGFNQYKNFIKNLIGIDLVNDAADIKTDISVIPFDDNSADVVLCFGSINFGDRTVIQKQLLEVTRVLKQGGYAIFRGNMKDHNDIKDMYYGWNAEKIAAWTEELNMTLYEGPVPVTRINRQGEKDLDWIDRRARRTPHRLFWIWKK